MSEMNKDRNSSIPPHQPGHVDTNGTGRQPVEVEARLLLTADGDQGPEEIERALMQVLEALTAHGADVVVDLVGSCNLERREIELEFNLAANTDAEVHRCFGQVLEIIQAAVPVARELASETRVAEPELAVA